MIRKTLVSAVLIVCLVLALGIPALADAAGQIELKPYVSATYTFNDNVFGYASPSDALRATGSSAMSDRTLYAEAGINADWKISRQDVILQLGVNRSTYDRFSFLNNDGDSKKIGWMWSLGNHLSGELSTSDSKSMSGFTDVHVAALNMRKSKINLMSMNWEFDPRWKLKLQGDKADNTNSSIIYKSSNRKDVGKEIALQYQPSSGNSITLTWRNTDIEYPNRDAFSSFLFGKKNHQQDLKLSAIWQPTGKITLNAGVGRIDFADPQVQRRDFRDWNGQFGMVWQMTGNTMLQAGFSHDIYNVDDLTSNYAQTDRFTIGPVWTPTSKITLKGNLTLENRSYFGDTGFVSGVGPRVENLTTAALTMSYVPYDKIKTELTAQKTKRDSNAVGSGYEANSVSANVHIDF